MLVTIIKKYKRHYTCIKVLCFAEISARIRSIHFSGWISLVLWVVGVEKSLSWITFEPEVLVQGVIGRGVVGGFQVTWSCWEKKITNGERYKLFISTIFSLYSISLHFRLEFFFFFPFCSKYQFFLKPLAQSYQMKY